MSSPRIKDFSILENFASSELFLEKRMEYDGNNLIYVGYSRNPNESVLADTWFIVKMTYDGSNVTRYQLPDAGPSFSYAWNDRASLFT